jgi:TPR repeat protein
VRAFQTVPAITAIAAGLFSGVPIINAQNAGRTPAVNVQQITGRATAGDVQAMVTLGYLHLEGASVPRDPAAAARWYSAAAQKKHPVAMNNYGWMHEHGIGVTRNPDDAALWYQRAADAGNVTAMTNLAQLYKYGLVGGDAPEDAAWYTRYPSGGRRPAGVIRNDTMAMQWLRKAAQAGDGTAMAEIVEMYRTARTEDNPGERRREIAASWAEKAAAAGSPHGLYQMAFYATPEPRPAPPPGGTLTPEAIAAMRTPESRAARNAEIQKWQTERENERMHFLRRAAEMGHSLALSEYAGLLRPKWTATNNDGFYATLPPKLRADADRLAEEARKYTAEFPIAAGWLRKAANEGDADAMAWFGEWTCNGMGVPKNEPEGVKWILKSVEAGSLQGHLTLSKMHTDGLYGYPKDPAKGREVLQQLATHPDPRNAALGKQFLADRDASDARAAQRRAGPWENLRPVLMLMAVHVGLSIIQGEGGSAGSSGGVMLPDGSSSSRTRQCRYEAINAQTVHGTRAIMGGPGTRLICD